MSETAKTCAFVAVAVLAVAGAVFSDSSANAPNMQALVGMRLNEGIDLAAPRRLQIVKFNRQTAAVRQFEVAEIDGVWSIPSKENYPADAADQMAAAATCVMDRKILRVAGDSAQSHEEFGVVDPLAAKLDSKSLGVGTHVTMTDASDAVLVDMIIGKAVKDNPNQRYVRRANQDVVYIVELDPTQLSTSFEDWIEDDLMQLNVADLRQVFINDYTTDMGIGIGADGRPSLQIDWDRRNEIALSKKEDASTWALDAMTKVDQSTGTMVPDALAEDEEINQEAITELVNGLDQLLIVDVARKPAGLSADLKAGEAFLTEEEAVSDLVQKGFIPGRQASGADMLSSEGEVVCTLRNGVEYVLRFGQLKVQTESGAGGEAEETAAADAAAPTGAAAGADEAKDGAAKTEGEGANLRRYLFVMSRFNEGAVEAPKYKELPELPAEDAGAAAPAETGAAPTADGDAAAVAEPADEAATVTAADAQADDAKEPSGDNAAEDAQADESADEPGNGAADTNADKDEPKDDDKVDEKKVEADREAIIAKRKEIEQENDRLREEYEAQISAGREKNDELNARFGDWYFVISNDVYKKIHLGRDKVIKKKTPPAAEGGTPAASGGESTEPSNAAEGLPPIGGAAQ